MVAYVRGFDNISLVSRTARDWTDDLPFLRVAFHKVTNVRARNVTAIFDGEVALPDENGVTRVDDMRRANKTHLVYFAFDLLWWDDQDLRREPLIQRKAQLKRVLAKAPPNIVYSDHVVGPAGGPFYDAAVAHGCEGIVSKVLNPRVRDKKVFAEAVENIADFGLKRPVTVRVVKTVTADCTP